MKVDAETWADLVMMAKAGAMSWQASAEAVGLPDRFTVLHATKDGRSALLARRVANGREVEARCVMRFEDTGSVFPCKFDRRDRKWKPKPARHAWAMLTGASVEAIWKMMRLLDFTPVRARERAFA